MSEQSNDQRLVHAYEKMLERVTQAIREAKEGALPNLQHALEAARDKAVELGELSREEAEKVLEYVLRDLADAASTLKEEESDLSQWLRFDVELLEERMAEALQLLADPTEVALTRLALQAEAAGWHTGEITGPGVLVCDSCGEELHFHKPGHIPPCPRCHGTSFHRQRAG